MTIKSSGRQTLAITIAFYLLAVISTALRPLVRRRVNSTMTAAEYTMIATVCLFTVYCAIVFHALAQYGTISATDVSVPDLLVISKLLYIDEYFIGLVIALTKISILLFYRSIFAHPRFRLLVMVTIGAVVAWYIGTLFVVVFQCSPVPAAYDPVSHPTANCIPIPTWVAGYEASNILLDLIILTLPINEVRKLHMKLARKIAISAIFAIGAFVIMTSFFRIFFGYPPHNATGAVLDLPKAINWTTVQLGSAILCGNLPAMRPLLPESLSSLSNSINRLLSSLGSQGSTSRIQHQNSASHARLRENGSDVEGNGFADGTPVSFKAKSSGRPAGFDNNIPLDHIAITHDVEVTIH